MFKYFMPTKVLVGANCVTENPSELILGKKAFIVTGKSSGKRSGALTDVENVLKNAKIPYYVYDKIENNPEINDMVHAGSVARQFCSDFVIGIGGGGVEFIQRLLGLFGDDLGKGGFPDPRRTVENHISNSTGTYHSANNSLFRN